MEIREKIEIKGRLVFRKLIAEGVKFELASNNKLRVLTATTERQFELIRIWKAQIIDELSPKCPNCHLAMNLLEKERLWFCPLGCGSRKA